MVYKKNYKLKKGEQAKRMEITGEGWQQCCTLMLINVNMLIVGIVAHFPNFVQFYLHKLIIYVYYKALKC